MSTLSSPCQDCHYMVPAHWQAKARLTKDHMVSDDDQKTNDIAWDEDEAVAAVDGDC